MTYTVNLKNDITICIIDGKATFEESMDTMIEFYKSPSKHFMWDLRKADLENMLTDQLERILRFVIRNQSKRPEGAKTAILVERDLEYGLSRMMLILAEMGDLNKIKLNIFRDYNNAIDWLNSEIDLKPIDPNPIENYFSPKK